MKYFGKLVIIGLFLSILVLNNGCTDNAVYENKLVFQNDVWTYQDSLACQFNMADTIQQYDLVLTLEHSDTYPFQNLYLKINTLFPDKKLFSQSVSLEMADFAGRWLGERSGKKVKLEIPIQEAAVFRPSGEYKISFLQDMRESSINGLHSLSFKVIPTKVKK